MITGDFASDFGVVNTGRKRQEKEVMKEEEENGAGFQSSEGERSLDSGDAEIRDENLLYDEERGG